MWENEKLGFTFEVKPYDYSAFNRFFGATTDWVDEGSSAVPQVSRDSLYPQMSPSPLKDDADFKRLSEEQAQQINKAFENIRKTMEKDFPMAFAKRKARKYYKPKFTL
jgi:hypothetical protein